MVDFRKFKKVSDGQPWGQDARIVLSQAGSGKTNNVQEVTLDANAASTVLLDDLIFESSLLSMTPRTANAQAITWRQGTTVKGSITINHTNDANADKTFRYSVTG